jgi:hypothetical protein
MKLQWEDEKDSEYIKDSEIKNAIVEIVSRIKNPSYVSDMILDLVRFPRYDMLQRTMDILALRVELQKLGAE